SKDKAVADAVCATFEANGIRCWVAPRDVPAGANWGAAIVEAMQASRVMILVFSEHANTSRQIAREVELAASQGVTIVPIRVEDVVPALSLQFFLSNIHWLDALTPPLEQRLHEIAAKIKAILQHEGTIAAGPKPAPETTRLTASPKPWRWIIPAGAVVLAAISLFVWRPWSGAKQTPSAPPPAPAAALDPALIGKWAYVTTILDADVHVEFSLDRVGRYTFRKFMDSDGLLELKEGTAKVKDTKKGTWSTATYTFPSDDQLNWYTPDLRIALSYRRAGGERVADKPIVGKWRATTFLLGLNWDATWEIRPDLSFHIVFENADEGIFAARDGNWKATSDLGRPNAEGIYRRVTPDSFEMSDPFFQMLKFERVARDGTR
ncbi:MAG TPA: toll/interleukin-1 receptor domain-containing protein, partial [Chthoniobacterales bacterium]|nr:toll/interleukin-1 receptor domain-containing protein [Chthoniobacterales bacterium]